MMSRILPPFALSWMTKSDSATPFANVIRAVAGIPIRRRGILTSIHHGPKISASTIFS